MKVSFATLLALVLIFSEVRAAIDETNPAWLWFKNYLTGMDLLLIGHLWKYIYYYTWLILAKFVMCTWFADLGSMFVPGADAGTLTAEEKTEKCNKGLDQYYDATMYGGGPDNLPYSYFRSYKPTTTTP